MNKNALEVLICPETKSELDLFPIENTRIGDSEEITIGLLQSKKNAGIIYPIVNGIPRMLPNSLQEHLPAILEYRDRIPVTLLQEIEKNNVRNASAGKAYTHAKNSFSSEWKELKSGRAWGVSLEFRKQHFLKCLQIEAGDLFGKTIFDAGCGNGDVDVSLIDSGANLFSMDISDSVDLVRGRIENEYPELIKKICIVQGNVANPPFSKESFDYVFSSGVLHHTPNTQISFNAISETVKKGGRCSILVYSLDGKNFLDKIYYYTATPLKIITTKMPHMLLHMFCYIGAIFFWCFVRIVGIFFQKNRYTGRNRTLKEYELSLFDTYSPLYAHHHSTNEVIGWFEKLTYSSTSVVYTDHILTCVVGIK
jgi:SAM-dependent methyltransferase